jgi:acylphosphatase
MKRLDIRVRGIVQGVFFRASTQTKAHELGVTGTVQNDPDGTVFIRAEGREPALADFVAWCRQGPASAHVEDVEIEETAPQGYEDFHIT